VLVDEGRLPASACRHAPRLSVMRAIAGDKGRMEASTVDVQLERNDSVPVARLRGEIDVTQAPRLCQRLLSEVGPDDIGLVVDLTEVRYMESAGVRVLFKLAEVLRGRGLRLGVVVPPGNVVERVLTIVDLASVADVRRTVEFAVAGIHERRSWSG